MSLFTAIRRHFRITCAWLPVTAILVISLILSFPLLRRGLPYAHDTEEHLQRYVCFAAQISEGEIYPHWLTKLNGGLGSPVMFVYAPLAYYVPVALRPLLRLQLDGIRESREVAVSMWLALALSGLAAFLWLKSFVNQVAVATFGAVLYMAMPYHVGIDLYIRAAVAEVWAFVWMPLILYFSSEVVRTRARPALAKLAIAYALLIFTHLLTTLIFTPVVLAFVFLAKRGERGSALLHIVLALSLGAGLSAPYLGPALEHERYVSPFRLGQLRPTLSYENNFLTLWRGGAVAGEGGDLLWKFSWIALSAMAVAIVAFAMSRNWSNRMCRFWIAVAAISTAMMFPASRFLWKAIPQLAAIQFPYRFNTILAVATVALVAIAVDSIRSPLRAAQAALAAGIAAGIAVWIVTDIKMISKSSPWQLSSAQPLASRPLVQDILLGGWSHATDPLFLRQKGVLQLSRQAMVQEATLKWVSVERPTAREIRLTEDGAQGWISVPLLFYHGWTATIETGEMLPMRAASTGLTEIEVPSGLHRIKLAMPWDWMETAATISAVLCALLSAILIAAGSKASAGGVARDLAKESAHWYARN